MKHMTAITRWEAYCGATKETDNQWVVKPWPSNVNCEACLAILKEMGRL